MARFAWLALAGAALALLLTLRVGPARAVPTPLPAAVGPGEVYLALGDSLATGDEAPANTAEEGNLPGYPVYVDLLLDYHPQAAGHWNLAYGFFEAAGYGRAPRAFLPLAGR